MPKSSIPEVIRSQVMLRSNHCCEYCKSQDRFSPVFFTIDHIIPIVENGTDDIENLAYSCPLCNRLKWQKTSAIDPVTNIAAHIFNPRLNAWQDHFQWSEDFLQIIGITAVGRATVNTLRLNREKLVRYRKEMFDIGQHPSK